MYNLGDLYRHHQYATWYDASKRPGIRTSFTVVVPAQDRPVNRTDRVLPIHQAIPGTFMAERINIIENS